MLEKRDELSLEGQIVGEVFGPTTNQYIAEKVRLLKSETSGIPNPLVVIEGEVDPVSITTTSLLENTMANQIEAPSMALRKDSPVHILDAKIQKRVAADTRNFKSLKELQKAA